MYKEGIMELSGVVENCKILALFVLKKGYEVKGCRGGG